MWRNESYWFFITFCLFSMLWSKAPLYAQKLGAYVEQFECKVGSRDLKVELLKIGEVDTEEMLIRISGVDDPLNEQIYRYKKVGKNTKERLKEYEYVTYQIPGNGKHTAFKSENEFDEQVFKVYLIAKPEESFQVYPAGSPVNLEPKVIYEEYLRQREMRKKQ
ncbi:hypothetical protein C9994_03155 [Marivirga lumbricoides]|uniref:Uncharacterized protein n=1 Tax=Marivirga lumbricoides TaxID=1046115 RepID=A0A2T4DUJ8_9BACT|nr:hypothetical protein C9994_03155 [Marivirga lumbricoides]